MGVGVSGAGCSDILYVWKVDVDTTRVTQSVGAALYITQ